MTHEQLLEALHLGEDQEIEFKTAEGGLPKSLWETVSAFANTEGGTIVLGVTESDGVPVIQGVRKPQPLQKSFWDGHNNPQKLNHQICRESDVSILTVDSHILVCIHIPRVPRQQRPIYINNNPLIGTFKRKFEGDYRCSETEVKLMLRDAGDEPLDNKILEGYTIDDLDSLSLSAYRNRFASRDPDHPFLAKSDHEFLESLGGWRRDRRTKLEGITLAGLLMFGKERSLLDALPQFHLDYQEKLSNDPDVRWTDRITIDGKWVPNLFNFYYRIYPRLVEDIDIPFKLDKNAVRKEETHVHEAMREALVNTLVHADHQSSKAIKIIKQKEVFIFFNPGRLRIPREMLYQQSGMSDTRNPNLLKMFQMLGLAEKAGSGFPKILRAWQEQHWMMPLVAEHPTLEMTGTWLQMVSMIPEDIENELRSVVGDRYQTLDDLGRIVLLLAHRFSEISNKDIQHYRNEHPRDIGTRLSQFVNAGWLEKVGQGTGTRYRWPSSSQISGLDRWNDESVSRTTILSSSEHLQSSSEHLQSSSEHLQSSSEHLDSRNEGVIDLTIERKAQLLQIALPVRDVKKVAKAIMEETILTLCNSEWLTLRTLTELLNRHSDTLRTHYINAMLKDGRLEALVPSSRNHPGQAYRRRQPK
jgi:ATP-dependent DNA helicase RecG